MARSSGSGTAPLTPSCSGYVPRPVDDPDQPSPGEARLLGHLVQRDPTLLREGFVVQPLDEEGPGHGRGNPLLTLTIKSD